MYIVKVDLKNLDVKHYKEFIETCDNATPFHNIEWLIIINEIRDDLNLKFYFIKENNKTLAVMPVYEKYNIKFIMSSLPYSCYGGFVYSSLYRNEIEKFLKDVGLFKFKIVSIFTRDNLYSGLLYGSQKLYTYTVDCSDDYNTVFSKFSTKTRNQVRKANKSGIEYKLVDKDEEVKDCISLYKLLIKKHRIKSPYNNKLFYLLKEYNGRNLYFYIAKYNGIVIAYSVFINSKNSVFYWLSAFDNKYSKFNAPLGILSTMIDKACEKKQSLNLGAVPYGNDSLKHFKEGLGAEMVEYRQYYSAIFKVIKKIRG